MSVDRFISITNSNYATVKIATSIFPTNSVKTILEPLGHIIINTMYGMMC